MLSFLYDPERATKTLGPIESQLRTKREAEAREKALAARKVEEARLMPAWLRTDAATPPTPPVGPADTPLPPREND